LTPAQLRERDRHRRMANARTAAIVALGQPENARVRELVELYLDIKDHGGGTSLSDLSPLARRAFRIIRQASGGMLGGTKC
jgi:hypothetical protein